MRAFLKPGVLIGGVVDDQVGDDFQAALVGGIEQRLEVGDGAVVGVDAHEIGNVVAVVLVRRGIHRQQPDAIDAELLDVVEFSAMPRKSPMPLLSESKNDLTGAS